MAGRTVAVVAIVCVGFGAGGAAAVQAGASGGPAGPISRTTHPKPVSPQLLRQLARSGALRASADATNALCGQTITASLTLNGDLSCGSQNGLTVSGANVVLNLNGHQIIGNDIESAFGVHLSGATETVTNGVVAGFGMGVSVTGTGDTVSAVRAIVNYTGIEDHGLSTKLTNDFAILNGVGIASFASTATYSGDHELNNDHQGLTLESGHGVTVSSNVANGNREQGIVDYNDPGTTLRGNTASYNGQDGIVEDAFFFIDGGGNLAKGNDYGSGATPEQCVGVVCS